jgi:hypothetical protein
VKPETTRGPRKSLPRRKRGRRLDPGGDPDRSRQVPAGVDPDFDPVEFAEFLEADEGPLPIDPGFRERLREQLWEIVRGRAAERRTTNTRPRRTP